MKCKIDLRAVCVRNKKALEKFKSFLTYQTIPNPTLPYLA